MTHGVVAGRVPKRRDALKESMRRFEDVTAWIGKGPAYDMLTFGDLCRAAGLAEHHRTLRAFAILFDDEAIVGDI